MNKCLGAFLIFITIPLVALSILELSLLEFQSAKIYKNAFRKTDSYSNVKTYLDKAAVKQNNQLLLAMTGSIDARWLETNIEKNLDATFLYMRGKTKELNFDLNVAALKQGVLSQNAMPASIVTGIPDNLTPETLTQSMENLQKAMAQLTAETGQSVQNQQNTLDYNLALQKNSQTGRKAFQRANIGMWIIYGLTLFMLLMIILSARKYPPAILNWVGQTLIYGGLVAGLLNFLGVYLFNRLNLKVAADLGELVNPLIKYFFTAIANRIQLISLIVGAVGLVLMIVGIILSTLIKKPEIQPAPVKPKAT